MQRLEQYPPTQAGRQARCACYERCDARECYELRYYGHSPIPRTDWDHSEAAYFLKDDGECECPCHADDDEDDF